MKVLINNENVLMLDSNLTSFSYEHLFKPLSDTFNIFTPNVCVPGIGLANYSRSLDLSEIATSTSIRLNSVTIQKKLGYWTKGIFIIDQKHASTIRPLKDVRLTIANHGDEEPLELELITLLLTPLSTYIIPVNAFIRQAWIIVLTDMRYIAKVINVPHNVVPNKLIDYLKFLLEYSNLAPNTLNQFFDSMSRDELASNIKCAFDPKHVMKQVSVIDVIKLLCDVIFVQPIWNARKKSLDFYSYYCATPQPPGNPIPNLDTRNKLYKDIIQDTHAFIQSLANGLAANRPIAGGYQMLSNEPVYHQASWYWAKVAYDVYIYTKTWNNKIRVQSNDPKIELPRLPEHRRGPDYVNINVDMELFEVPRQLAELIAYKAVLRYKVHTALASTYYVNYSVSGFQDLGGPSVTTQYYCPCFHTDIFDKIDESGRNKSIARIYDGLSFLNMIPRTTWTTEPYMGIV